MDAADLKVFEAVARLGGIGRAALELHTVQSNVTTRIRLLEQELGTQLFERHSRGVTLTAAGRRLLPYADEVKDLLQRARRAAMDDGTPRGPLTIGTLETTVAIRLPRIIAALHSLPPYEAMVDTLFIRRRDGQLTSALSAFMQMLQERSVESLPTAAE